MSTPQANITTVTTTTTSVIGFSSFSHNIAEDAMFEVQAVESNTEIFDAECFFVYTGTYGEKQFPIFEYYYPSNDISGTNYKHRKSYYKGAVPDDLKYGDIFVTAGDVVTTLDENTRNTYELDQSTELRIVGNCSELMETQSLQIVDKTYSGMTMPPVFAVFTFHLSDENENKYYYSFDNFASTLGMNISGANEGDTLSFAVYNDSVIVPVMQKTNTDKATGDVNDDGEFNISDVVLLQKWLLSVPDTHLAKWRAGNFCIDDRLDVFDLCLMKRQLIDKLNENTNSAFELQSVSNVQTNVDNHNEWQGYIANSENELNEIIQENEGGDRECDII